MIRLGSDVWILSAFLHIKIPCKMTMAIICGHTDFAPNCAERDEVCFWGFPEHCCWSLHGIVLWVGVVPLADLHQRVSGWQPGGVVEVEKPSVGRSQPETSQDYCCWNPHSAHFKQHTSMNMIGAFIFGVCLKNSCLCTYFRCIKQIKPTIGWLRTIILHHFAMLDQQLRWDWITVLPPTFSFGSDFQHFPPDRMKSTKVWSLPTWWIISRIYPQLFLWDFCRINPLK